MRRLLAIALAAGPLAASALTPNAGQVLFNDSAQQFVINADACASTQTVDLTWQVKPDVSFLDLGGTFNVYAASLDRSSTPYCWTDADPGTATVKVLKTGIAAPAAIYSGKLTGPVSDLVGVTAQSGCASGSFTAYVCVQWLDSTGAVKGYAKGTAKVELDRPNPPTVTLARPDDRSLYAWVSAASTGEPAETFRARAVVAGTLAPVYESPETPLGEKAKIEGLTNGTDYYVSAVAYSKYGNASDPSPDYREGDPAPTAIRPTRVLDFWEYYRDGGGRDSGGCQSGAAGLVALVGAAALLRLRRRS